MSSFSVKKMVRPQGRRGRCPHPRRSASAPSPARGDCSNKSAQCEDIHTGHSHLRRKLNRSFLRISGTSRRSRDGCSRASANVVAMIPRTGRPRPRSASIEPSSSARSPGPTSSKTDRGRHRVHPLAPGSSEAKPTYLVSRLDRPAPGRDRKSGTALQAGSFETRQTAPRASPTTLIPRVARAIPNTPNSAQGPLRELRLNRIHISSRS